MNAFSATLRAGVALVALLSATAALAEDYKIGVLRIDRVLQESSVAKEAQTRIEKEFQPRDSAITQQEKDLQAQQARFDKDKDALAKDVRATRERELEQANRDAQRMREKFAEDLRARQFEELDRLKERLDQVLTRFAHDQNFDLILQDAPYWSKSLDITDAIIKLLDAAQSTPLPAPVR
jgi:outer membrane protein